MHKVRLLGGIAAGVSSFLLVTLIPVSYHSLEYYQYGFVRQKSTGRVYTAKLYRSGKYFLGLDYEFKIFPADAHHVYLSQIEVFTVEKLKVQLTVTFQYFLRPSDLHLLHRAYDLQYPEVVRSRAIDAVKRVMPKFNIYETFTNRRLIEHRLYESVQERLGGKCCSAPCPVPASATTGFKMSPSPALDVPEVYVCPLKCMPPPCDEKDKGIFVDVRYFQLRAIDIPDDVGSHYLHQVVLEEEGLRELLYQEAVLMRKETEVLVHKVHSAAIEVIEAAKSESELILTVSFANYTKIIETARCKGLQVMFKVLGITSQKHKSSLDYLQSLLELDNGHLTIDFQQIIAGNL